MYIKEKNSLMQELIPMLPSLSSIENNGHQKGKNLSLEFLFDNLDLSCIRPIRRRYSLNGKPHDPRAMFRALLLKEIRQISSRRKLANFLRHDEFWLRKCGFDSPPHHDCFSKFIQRVRADAVEQVFNELVKQIGEIKDIGKIVAIDSTLIKGYARYWKNKKCSDPDAAWGITIKDGRQEWVFGYKAHIVADAELELPLGFEVTPANVYDSTRYQPLLMNLMKWGVKPKIIIADKGYDSKSNYSFTREHEVVPIIAMNPRNLKEEKERDFEADLPIKRNSDGWKELYKKRGAVERINSRLKEELCLKAVKVRTLDRVRVHVSFSLIAMLAVAQVAIKSGNGNLSASVNSFRF